MATLVTGATGFIGGHLCRKLASQSQDVVAFCRQMPTDGSLDHPRIRVAVGDINLPTTLSAAFQGCQRCVHLAGLAKQWSRSCQDFYKVNVEGTRNVFDAAVDEKLEQFVFVSTAGVYGASTGDSAICEGSPIPDRLGTHYENSKRLAELLVLDQAERHGINVCIVCPTRVFGPGVLSEANSVTRIIQQYQTGSWWMLPGDGSAIGNYVYIDDVVSGLLNALAMGRSGQRYILGGENISYRQLFDLIGRFAQQPRRLYQVPWLAAMAYARMQLLKARLLKRPPKLTPAFVRKYYANYRFDFERTRQELHYQPRDLTTAIRVTMEWLEGHETSARTE